MKQLIARLDRNLQRRYPQAYYALIQKPRIRFRFQAERKLARGVSLSSNSHKSILYFTTQKCASRYVNEILIRLARAEGLQPIDFDAYLTMVQPAHHLSPFSAEGTRDIAFHQRGYYYGPIGSFREIPKMEKYAVVLQLRDPRDVLTSLYYSTVYSHSLINPKLIQQRMIAQKMTIDEFVEANTEEFVKIYWEYCEKLLDMPGCLFMKYEHMVEDFSGWLREMCKHIDLSQHHAILEALIAEANFEVGREDKYAQRRQVTPGDHRRKLVDRTVAMLNERFEPILTKLDYPVGPS